jgi:tetratricopeptide (TPR) repeat protein
VSETGIDAVESEEVRAALASILASEQFRDSPQLRAFLSYVVLETLAGRADDLKGYTIATSALGRPESFDPQADPIVRVQAGRVRQALAEHYSVHPDARLRIELERGSYAPVFRRLGGDHAEDATSTAAQPLANPPTPAAPAGATPVPMKPEPGWPARRTLFVGGAALAAFAAAVAVIYFRPLPQPGVLQTASRPSVDAESFYPVVVVQSDPATSDQATEAMAARLRDALARFDDLIVVAESERSDMASAPRTPFVRPPGRDLMLRVTETPADVGRTRVGARLLDRRDNRVVWSREFDPFPNGTDGDQQRLAIIRSIASTVAQPYGVIHAHVRARMDMASQSADPYGCLVTGFDYWQTNDQTTHATVRNCIVAKLKDHATNGALHAQLAYLHLEEFRHGYNPLPGDPLARALEQAQLAVRLAPASARSHQALLAALFSRRDIEGAWRAANEALALNPYDTDIMADVAARHIQAGRFERGLQLLRDAFELNTAPPVWARTYQAMALYMLNRVDEASTIATQLEETRYPPAMVATLLVAYQRRDAAKAKERLSLFRGTHPAIAADFSAYLHRLNFNDLMFERVMASYTDAVAWTDSR